MAVLESRNVPSFVVVHQIEDQFVHELRCFGLLPRRGAEVQLFSVEDDELGRDLLEDAVGDLGLDRPEPVLEDFLRRCGNHVSPGPVVVALCEMG